MERYQKYTPKPTNIAEQKTALLLIRNDFPQEFTDKANPVILKETSIIAAAGGHFEQ